MKPENDGRRERLQEALKAVWTFLVLYFDDLLFTAGGICFLFAAVLLLGGAAAVAVAGVWLTVSAFLVARSKRGGRK